MSGRKLAYLAPISWIAVGVATLAMPFVFEAKDEFGLLFGLAFGATCLGMGAFQLWRLKKDDPRTTAYTVNDLPIEQRASALRRLMWLFGAAIIVGTGMTAYELVELEYGGAERATVWAPPGFITRSAFGRPCCSFQRSGSLVSRPWRESCAQSTPLGQ